MEMWPTYTYGVENQKFYIRHFNTFIYHWAVFLVDNFESDMFKKLRVPN